MGCMSSKSKGQDKNGSNNGQNGVQKKNTNIEKLEDFKVNQDNLVIEKEKILNDYTLLNPPLGKGAYGEVRKAVHKASQLYRAVKIINKQSTPQAEQERLKQEVEILKSLDHPNIIKVYEFYSDKKYLYIVTELCSGGELFDKIIEEKQFSEKHAAETIKQVLSAVNYCHQNHIMHRDLKPENILYDSNGDKAQLKVVDFGTSIAFDPHKKIQQKLGTPYYIAPEVLDNKYDEKCDIWSCGVILYILLCGYPPFNGPKDEVIMEKVKVGKYGFDTEEWVQVSDNAKNLIRHMLEKDPSKRYSAQQCLLDPWIKQHDDNQIQLPLLQKSLNNMKNFRTGKKFQEAIWMFLVNYLASKEEKNELLDVFKSLDTNCDGKLSKEELIVGYRKVLPPAEAEEEANRIMSTVDKNNSGAIDYSEFVMATINKEQMLSKQRLETTFKMFDRDNSGTLSKDEIKQMFQGVGEVSDQVWQELIKEVDDNGDGQISYQEFKGIMEKILDPNQI